MSSLKQKAMQCSGSIPESGYVRTPSAGPLPFRPRDAANSNRVQPLEHRVKWEDTDANPRDSHVSETRSPPASKGNVRSWLDSASPTSVIEQAQDPPTPSPICSPSPSSPVHSPRPALAASSEAESAKAGRSDDGLASGSKKFEKSRSLQNGDALPDGSAASSVSEGGLLALLASKLFSNKENSKDKSGPVDDKHVMEDRSNKPAVNEFHGEKSSQPAGAMANHPLRRSSSEISLGSADNRTLSMEFDAILAAAVAAGVSNALDMEGRSASTASTAEESAGREQLPGIQENSSFRSLHPDDPNMGGVERNEGSRGVELGSTAVASTALAAAAARRGDDTGHAGTGNCVGMPSSSRSPNRGGMRASSPDDDTHVHGSSAVSENGVKSSSLGLALTNDKSFQDGSRISPSSSEGSSKENIAPSSSGRTLETVRKDKILAQALAYQEAKNSKYSNRFKREEAKINAWENQQRIKATVNMKKFEMKLEEERAKALEKMQNEIALAHKRAEERKAYAEAVRGTKAAKVGAVTDNMRKSGKISTGCFPF